MNINNREVVTEGLGGMSDTYTPQGGRETTNPETTGMEETTPAPAPNGEREDVTVRIGNEGEEQEEDESPQLPVTVPLDGPMTNLPKLGSPELRIIGRCVVFTGTTIINGEEVTFYYKGLVSFISKDTVVLMHSHRFTTEYYENFRNKNKEIDGTSEGAVVENAVEPSKKKKNKYSAKNIIQRAIDESGNKTNVSIPNDNEFLPENTTPVPPSTMGAALSPLDRSALKEKNDYIGPIPYLTFSRKRIGDVALSDDPPDKFFSLFTDPAKSMLDEQYLRMFVRRYIVHTSQKDNPRKISLRAFLTQRCSLSPNFDNERLTTVALEEAEHLHQTDKAMKSSRKRRIQDEREDALLNYEAPRGMFQNTGILYLTKVPVKTFTIATFQFLLSMLMSFLVVGSFTMSESLVIEMVFSIFPVILGLVFAASMASVLTLSHSTRMQIPMERDMIFLSILRLCAATAGIVMSVLVICLLLKSSSQSHIDETVKYSRSSDFCSFYYLNDCSGYELSCPMMFEQEMDDPYRLCTCFFSPFSNVACRPVLQRSVSRYILPLVVCAGLLAICFISDHYLHFKLFRVYRALVRHLQ